jgi:protein-tyrosine kinase
MANEENEKNEVGDPREPGKKEQRLVRLIKSVVENPERGGRIDEGVVQFRYFNAFNMSLGITSARRGEGKTLVACNLAVSLAMGFQKKTVLVDLNFAQPRIHDIFGLSNATGLAEAFTNGAIHVSRTLVEHLYVLNAGVVPVFHDTGGRASNPSPVHGGGAVKPLLGLDQLTAFRDVIYSLEQEFDFVIVDMPSVGSDEIPALFHNQLNGLLIVVDSGKTKKDELDAMFQKVNQRQVLGFVFNRVHDRA